MLKQNTCPVCEGDKRLRGIRKVGLKEEEYEMTCWACKGSGTVWYEDSQKPKSLRTIVPGDEDASNAKE
jgi:DnaJ-class molecular chaperone